MIRKWLLRPLSRAPWLAVEEALGAGDDAGLEFVAVGLVGAGGRLQALDDFVLVEVLHAVDAQVEVGARADLTTRGEHTQR